MFFILYLLIVMVTVWGIISISFGFFAVIICILSWIYFDRDIAYVAPCVVAPFFILFRAQDIDNILGALVLDFFMFLSIMYFVFNISKKSFRFPAMIRSIPIMALTAHLLYTCLNGIAHSSSASSYIVFLRMYAIPIIYLITFILAVQKNHQLIGKGLNYFFLSISIVVLVALAQYFSFFEIPTRNWLNFGKYFVSVETADLDKGTGTLSERGLFWLSGIRINLLLGGSLGTIASLLLCLSLIQLIFKNIIASRNIVLYNSFAIIGIVGAIFTFSTSMIIAVIWTLVWIFIYKKISFIASGLIILVATFFLLTSQSFFGISPITYFNESILESISSLFHKGLLLDWLFGIGPAMYVAGYEIQPDNYITDVGLFKVMQESGIINMLFVIIFIYFTYSRSLYALKIQFSKQRIVCAIILSTCLTSVHINCILQVPFNILFAIAVAGSLAPISEEKSSLTKPYFLYEK